MTPEDIYYDEAPERAKDLLSSLAAAGDAEAMFYLGHLAGESIPRLEVEAYRWYNAAAELGHLEAGHWVASYLYHGFGTPQDLPRALKMFERYALLGLDASQWKLGQHLLADEDRRHEARKWLSLAAAQGHPDAARLLAEAGDV
jgi:TPR repeat protein